MQTNTDLKNSINELKAQGKLFENQLAQLSHQSVQIQRQPNQFPSQPEPSNRGPHHINTLNSNVPMMESQIEF